MNSEALACIVELEQEQQESIPATAPEPLRSCVHRAMHHYFKQLDGQDASDLYKLVLAEVEAPLFEIVLEQAGGNQTRAANMLGISRSTLRKKIELYQLDN